jgi:hypothetical protein
MFGDFLLDFLGFLPYRQPTDKTTVTTKNAPNILGLL